MVKVIVMQYLLLIFCVKNASLPSLIHKNTFGANSRCESQNVKFYRLRIFNESHSGCNEQTMGSISRAWVEVIGQVQVTQGLVHNVENFMFYLLLFLFSSFKL